MRILCVVAMHVGLWMCSAAVVSAQSAADETAVRSTVKRILETWNAHDAEANTALDDETYESWDGTVKGPDGDLKLLRELFAQSENKDIQRNMTEEIGIQFVTPDVALYKFRGEYTGFVDEAGTSMPPQQFIHAMVMVKRGGTWRLAASLNGPTEE